MFAPTAGAHDLHVEINLVPAHRQPFTQQSAPSNRRAMGPTEAQSRRPIVTGSWAHHSTTHSKALYNGGIYMIRKLTFSTVVGMCISVGLVLLAGCGGASSSHNASSSAASHTAAHRARPAQAATAENQVTFCNDASTLNNMTFKPNNGSTAVQYYDSQSKSVLRKASSLLKEMASSGRAASPPTSRPLRRT